MDLRPPVQTKNKSFGQTCLLGLIEASTHGDEPPVTYSDVGLQD